MKVSIEIEFDVEPTNSSRAIGRRTAETATEQAAYDFLHFIDMWSVKVDVPGFGECKVSTTN